MTTPTAISINFKTSFAQVAALDELALLGGKSRVDILREVIHIGLQEKLMELPELYQSYMNALLPRPKKPRGKIYRFNPPREN